MQCEGPLPRSQQPATGPEPDEPISLNAILVLFKRILNIIYIYA
jgi:hypothetical protein